MEKHILIVTTTNDFLRKFELNNVKILQQMGYTVHFAANMKEPHYISDEEKIRAMGVLTHHIEIARSPFLFRENRKALRQIMELLKQYPIGAIHCHTPVGGVLGRLAGKRSKGQKPVVIYTAHGFHFYRGAPLVNHLIYYHAERFLAHYTDILIVINEEDYRNARRLWLRRGGHVYKIPGVGLNCDLFRPLPEEERLAWRERLGIGNDEFFFISVGELNENKNHKIVLEAFGRMKERGKDISKIRYGICGDGFYREKLEQWILERGLDDTVALYGHCTNVFQIVGCADAMIFPSKREGLGMAGLEALAMGVPVIASDNRGTREYMEHRKNGFVCRHDDVEGFIRAIESVRNLSEERREKMKAYCIESVKPFDRSYACAVMRRIYSDVSRRIGWEQHGE